MVVWEPPPDVRFDQATAAAAVDEARQTLALLDGWLMSQTMATRHVLDAWSGAAREQTESTLSAHTARVSEIADRLNLLIGSLEDARDTALSAQNRRAAEQMEWEVERRIHQSLMAVGGAGPSTDTNSQISP